jgi:hypothetical protein
MRIQSAMTVPCGEWGQIAKEVSVFATFSPNERKIPHGAKVGRLTPAYDRHCNRSARAQFRNRRCGR